MILTGEKKTLGEEYIEALYYSEAQLSILKKHGSDAGVILLDGESTPVLWTETITNRKLLSYEEFLERGRTIEVIPANAVRSNFNDAVELHRGSGKGYKRLVDGKDEVTEDGQAYCKAHGMPATIEALRSAARKPSVA